MLKSEEAMAGQGGTMQSVCLEWNFQARTKSEPGRSWENGRRVSDKSQCVSKGLKAPRHWA